MIILHKFENILVTKFNQYFTGSRENLSGLRQRLVDYIDWTGCRNDYFILVDCAYAVRGRSYGLALNCGRFGSSRLW